MWFAGCIGEEVFSAQENITKVNRSTAIVFITAFVLGDKGIKLKRTRQLSFEKIPGKQKHIDIIWKIVFTSDNFQ